MTMPPLSNIASENQKWFIELRKIRDELQKKWPDCQELSMGTSHDWTVAVSEGATMIRIGTQLFGERPK